LLLAWYRAMARRRGLITLSQMCLALIAFGLLFFASALVITIPERLANLAELQPMRYLHLTYVLFLIFTGGFLAENVFRTKAWRWLVFFGPLAMGMWYAQRQIFTSTMHLEVPWREPRNEWVKAFLWIRDNTPKDAFFALDPEHMHLPEEDEHGFRAIAERSRLADHVKDAGAVTMFPRGADAWREQVRAQRGWNDF